MKSFNIARRYIESMIPLPAAEWSRLIPLLSEATYQKGELVFEAGRPFFYLGLVVRGLLRVFYTTGDGKEYIRAFCYEGHPFGPYSAIIRRTPANISMNALENTEVVLLDMTRFPSLYAEHSCWQELGRIMAERYILVREEREYQFMALDAMARLDACLRDHPNVLNRVPQYHVAAYLGISPITLSRMLSRRRS